jgi:hypothetical protein
MCGQVKTLDGRRSSFLHDQASWETFPAFTCYLLYALCFLPTPFLFFAELLEMGKVSWHLEDLLHSWMVLFIVFSVAQFMGGGPYPLISRKEPLWRLLCVVEQNHLACPLSSCLIISHIEQEWSGAMQWVGRVEGEVVRSRHHNAGKASGTLSVGKAFSIAACAC